MYDDWSYPLCGCFGDCSTCLLAYFCPCVIFGQNAEFVGDDKWTYCVLSCAALTLFPPLFVILRVMLRGRIRDQRGIEGSTLEDCACVYFCGLCTLVQEKRELDSPIGKAMLRE